MAFQSHDTFYWEIPGPNPAEDTQLDQHSGRLNGDKISLWPVIFDVFPTSLVPAPSHRTPLVPNFGKPHRTV